MVEVFESLLGRFTDLRLEDAKVIPWSSPVPMFGDIAASRVATLGINPSNREFLDQTGNELEGAERRFETLRSLGISRWSAISHSHLKRVIGSCKGYFSNNPYNVWFKRFDALLSGTNTSYYRGTASHLDLVPYATSCKWNDLSSGQRKVLLCASGNTLAQTLRRSPVRLLILNGSSVVAHLQNAFGVELHRSAMPDWALRSGERGSVPGYAYTGALRALGGISFKHKIIVLGFNHNIQSSFGVSQRVLASIQRWIGTISEVAFAEA